MTVRKSAKARVFHWKRYELSDVIFSICIASLHYIVRDISIPHEHLHGHVYIVHITRFYQKCAFILNLQKCSIVCSLFQCFIVRVI